MIADAGYKTPKFVHFLIHLKIQIIPPCTRPVAIKHFLGKMILSMIFILIIMYVQQMVFCNLQRLI